MDGALALLLKTLLNVGSLKWKADLDEGELGIAGDKNVNIGLEVGASPHCQDRHFHLKNGASIRLSSL